jgi:hypothetical protein
LGQAKGIDLVVGGNIDTSAGRYGGIKSAVAGHQLVRAAAIVNHGPGVAIVTMQTLVALGADHPHNHVIGAIGGGHERRSAAALAHGPPSRDGRRISGRNAEGRECVKRTKSHIRTRSGPIGCGRLDDGTGAHSR